MPMKRMYQTLLLLTFCLTANLSYAQEYDYSVGIRGGEPFGITAKSYWGYHGLETIIHDLDGFAFTALYEFYGSTGVNHLEWFVGGGAHFAFGNIDYSGRFGVDGIGGLEYYIPGIPFNLSADLQPALDLVESSDFRMGFGLSLRYCW